jgi:hypothetical protein
MSANRPDEESVFAKTWVHVFEEDTPAGATYRPEDSDIPLSRRPRERLVLEQDGSARILSPGPDDRFVEQPATWTRDGDTLVVRDAQRGVVMRVTRKTPDALTVHTRRENAPG